MQELSNKEIQQVHLRKQIHSWTEERLYLLEQAVRRSIFHHIPKRLSPAPIRAYESKGEGLQGDRCRNCQYRRRRRVLATNLKSTSRNCPDREDKKIRHYITKWISPRLTGEIPSVAETTAWKLEADSWIADEERPQE